MSTTRFYTSDEIADMFRVTKRTLFNWREAGKFPEPVKVNGVLLYPVERIEQFIEENERQVA